MSPLPSRRFRWALAATALLLGAAAGALLVRRSHPPPPRPKPPQWDDRIALKVQPSGDGLQLLWNAHAPAVRDAARATLLIHDGDRTSLLDLRPSDLASGTASYWPQTRDVTFRLQVFGAAGQSGESIRAFEPPEPVRPSPFVAEAMPRPAPPRAAPPPPTPPPPEVAAAKPPSVSRVHRIFRKIPLLGRLHKSRHSHP